MEQVQKKPQLAILMLLLSFGNVLGVLYAPALPNLTEYFHIAKHQTQETFSIYLVGGLIGQLLYAPIANALGRKPAIYIGGSFAVLGSLVCLFAIEISSFSLLLFGRGLTAFGALCGAVLTNILIADAYTFAETKKMLAYLLGGFAVIPSLCITVGGFITEYLSWKGCFYFMLLYSIFVIGLCVLLPETAKKRNLGHLNIKKIAKSYLRQSRNMQFFLYAGIAALGSIFLYIFSAEAPFIAMHQLHISADRFGLYNLIPNVGLLAGGIISARISHKLSAKLLLLIGCCMYLALSSIMWIFFEMNLVNILTLFGMPLLIFFTPPAIVSNGQALCFAVSEDKAYASSLMYTTQYTCMLLGVVLLSLFSPDNAAALPITYTISGILMIALLCVIKMMRSGHSHADPS